jgi:imidazolonepropionase-like amidohydrolase
VACGFSRRIRLLHAIVFAIPALALHSQTDRALAITDVRVFDGSTVIENQTVIVRGGMIEAVGAAADVVVPPNAERIAGTNRTLLPGLVDAHVHVDALRPVEALQQSLSFGVTTVIDMWKGPPPRGWTGQSALARLKEIQAADDPTLAGVLTAGTGATAPGGHPTQQDGGWPALVTPTISRAEDADEFVAARFLEGSDFLKIIYDDAGASYGTHLPTLAEDTIAALVQAAHARGRLAVAHIGSEEQARGALGAGVDGLAHMFLSAKTSADFGATVTASGAFVIPTLSVLYPLCGSSDVDAILAEPALRARIRPEFLAAFQRPTEVTDRSCEGTRAAVRQLAEADVDVVAGTDAPVPGTTFGVSLHWELEHLVNAGLSERAALASATSVPARVFRMVDRGRIAPGMRADLLLVEGNAAEDIRATRQIVGVWKRGVSVR